MTEESITGRDGFEQQLEAMIKDLVKEVYEIKLDWREQKKS